MRIKYRIVNFLIDVLLWMGNKTVILYVSFGEAQDIIGYKGKDKSIMNALSTLRMLIKDDIEKVKREV